MKDLNQTELFAAEKIITAGLLKAADSLSFFMKEKISFKELDYFPNWEVPSLELSQKEDSTIYLLITEVIGELKGICCLIFNEQEADQLRQAALPVEITSNPTLMAEMSDAIMLEVDNIITATVITQFANILKHKIHGGVPQLRKVNFDQLNKYIGSNINDELFIISFQTHFLSSKVNFNPEFLWFFDNKFIESIKRFAAVEDNIEKLKK